MNESRDEDQLCTLKQFQTHYKGFTGAHLNINSLVSKIDFVTQLVQNSAIDILALSETTIDSSISDSEIEIQNYSIMRRDQTRKGGGVCLFVSNSLKPRRRTDLEVVSDRSQFEYVWIQVEFCQNRSSLVCCCYRPPHGNVNDFISQFTAMMEAELDFSDDIIIIGNIIWII